MNANPNWLFPNTLHALNVAKGLREAAVAYAATQRHWFDRETICETIKAATSAALVGDVGDQAERFADSFLEYARDVSVPRRLSAMRPVPLRTQILVNSTGTIAVEVTEGNAIPVLKAGWTFTRLNGRRFAGITVTSKELAESREPAIIRANAEDLAAAVAEAENLAFCAPDLAGSIFYGAANFGGSGSTAAAIDSDLRNLLDTVRNSSRPGAAWIMAPGSANYLATVRGSGGDRAFPGVTALGGELLGLPVLLTEAMGEETSPPTRRIGLVQSSEILYRVGRVGVETSQNAALQMLDNPTTSTTTPTATTMVSMFQVDSVASRAELESDWRIRAGGSAYFAAGY